MSNNRTLGNLATYIDSASNGGAITKVGNDFFIQAMTDSDVGGTPATGFAGTDSASVKGLITTADIVQKSKQVKDAPGFKNIIQGNISKLNPSVTATYNIGDSSNPIDEIILDSSATIFFGAISLTSVLKSGTSAIAVAAAVVASPVAGSAETSFLLKTDSTQTDAQADASTNALTVTESGNVTSTAFTPYHPKGYSTYFDGTGDYIRYTDASLAEGTDDFTIEFWVKTDGAGVQNDTVLGHDTTPGYQISFSSGGLTFMKDTSNRLLNTGSLNDQQWYHVVYQRSSGTLQGFLDGTSLGTAALSNDFTNTTIDIGVNRGGTDYFSGSLRDVRIIKGTALYSSSGFNVPTEPLTAVSGTGYSTTLLTCHLPYITDGGENSLSATVNGNVKTELFSPYDHVAYSPSDHGGSVYFDGDGDYLTVASSSNFGFSADFTVEFWLYYTGGNGYKFFWTNNAGSGDYLGYGLNTGSLNPWLWNDANVITTSTAISTNTWQHHAVVRNGSTLTIYLDGVSIGSTTNTTTFGAGSQPFYIGWNGINNQQNTTGYISDMRVVNGSAIYTTDFTPPTEPLTAISGTQLLTCTNKNSIYDVGNGSLLTVNGDTTTSTSQTKYASSSVYFDGTGDYLEISDLDNLQFGTGDFTVEGWIYKSGSGANGYDCMIGIGQTANATTGWYLEVSPDRGIYFTINNNNLSYGTWTNDSTWHHIAVTRSSGSVNIWLDGTSVASGTLSTAVPTTGTTAKVGNYYNGSTNYSFNGYMEDVRVTKGLARYTTTFTPPTAALEG